MVATADALNLQPDNLAFVFDSHAGVSAADLGVFLQRAATVSRGVGVELYVVGLREGSLAVVAKAARKAAKGVAKNGLEEFRTSPIRTTASSAALVALVSAAIATAMTPKPEHVSPLAKAGAGLVEQHAVSQISLVTINKTTIVMDEQRAADVRAMDAERSYRSPAADIRGLISQASAGELSGTVVLVGSELHFRPDGFRYLVPIELSTSTLSRFVRPEQRVVVTGELLLRDSLPDLLVIRESRPG